MKHDAIKNPKEYYKKFKVFFIFKVNLESHCGNEKENRNCKESK